METSLLTDQLRRAIDSKEIINRLTISDHDLQKVDLSHLCARKLFATGTNLDDAVLAGLDIIEAADFIGASLNRACLRNSQLVLTSFNQCSMHEICMENVWFVNGDCEDSDLEGANLSMSVLTNATFFLSKLNRVNLENARAFDAGFNDIDMIGASLRNGYFEKASFLRSDLTGSDLSGGNFTGADFREATLKAVKWDNAILDGAQFDPGASPR